MYIQYMYYRNIAKSVPKSLKTSSKKNQEMRISKKKSHEFLVTPCIGTQKTSFLCSNAIT